MDDVQGAFDIGRWNVQAGATEDGLAVSRPVAAIGELLLVFRRA
jgi:hypothetical protein